MKINSKTRSEHRFSISKFFPALMLSGVVLSSSGNAWAAPVQAKMSDSFADSVGVNLHLKYTDTPYGLYDARVKPRLQELGVRHIRDGYDGTDSTFESKVLDLGNAGIKSTLIWHGTPQATVIAASKRLRSALQAVEGPNESDLPMMGFSYNGQGFPLGTRAYQRDLYSWIKGDATLSSLPVIQASMGWGGNAPTYGNQGSSADRGCGHFYTAWGESPGSNLDGWHLPYADIPTPGKTKVVTESGYHTATRDSGGGGISEWAQGRYVPRILTEHFRRGIERTFIYELLEQKNDPDTVGESHFGLVRYDNTVKPSFTAVKNLIALTNDKGSAFTPQSLDYTFTGGNALLRHFLLQKRDGTFQIVVWQDPTNYDVDLFQDIVVPNQNVTLTLAGKSGTVTTYLPMNGTGSSTLTLQNSAVTVSVPDHPMIIEVGASSPTPGNLIVNPSFDADNAWTQTPTGWSEWEADANWNQISATSSYVESYGGSNSGTRHGTHYKDAPYRVYTYQYFTGLTNGLYTLKAYARRSGNQTNCYLEAKDFGGTPKSVNIPASSSYQLIEVKNINVTNGKCTVGFWTVGGTYDSSYFDDVSFFKQ